MSFMFNRIYKEQTITDSGWTISLSKVTGYIKHIIVVAANATTTFDVNISDGSTLSLFQRNDQQGELNELTEIPVDSQLEIKITEASANEVFKVYLAVQEG